MKCYTTYIKGIFIDSNNIFLWYDSEDINRKKKRISKISVDSNFTFSSYAWLCNVYFIAPIDYCAK